MSVETGTKAPDLKLPASNGEEVQLSDFKKECGFIFLSERHDTRLYYTGL